MDPNINSNKDNRDPLYPFSIPEGYFDSFRDKLMARISAEEIAPSPNKPTILEALRPYLYAAAAVVAILMTIFAWDPLVDLFSGDRAQEAVSAEMTDDEFQQFLLDDTSEDYWGVILTEDDQNRTSSR